MVGRSIPRTLAILAAGTLALGLTTAVVAGAAAGAAGRAAPGSPEAGCALGPHGTIRHVIYIQFDNVHTTGTTRTSPATFSRCPT
jgi:hypothetical protein